MHAADQQTSGEMLLRFYTFKVIRVRNITYKKALYEILIYLKCPHFRIMYTI